MIQFYNDFKCEHCNSTFDTYITFGYPEEEFEAKWLCKNCGGENTLLVEANPYDGLTLAEQLQEEYNEIQSLLLNLLLTAEEISNVKKMLKRQEEITQFLEYLNKE